MNSNTKIANDAVKIENDPIMPKNENLIDVLKLEPEPFHYVPPVVKNEHVDDSFEDVNEHEPEYANFVPRNVYIVNPRIARQYVLTESDAAMIADESFDSSSDSSSSSSSYVPYSFSLNRWARERREIENRVALDWLTRPPPEPVSHISESFDDSADNVKHEAPEQMFDINMPNGVLLEEEISTPLNIISPHRPGYVFRGELVANVNHEAVDHIFDINRPDGIELEEVIPTPLNMISPPQSGYVSRVEPVVNQEHAVEKLEEQDFFINHRCDEEDDNSSDNESVESVFAEEFDRFNVRQPERVNNDDIESSDIDSELDRLHRGVFLVNGNLEIPIEEAEEEEEEEPDNSSDTSYLQVENPNYHNDDSSDITSVSWNDHDRAVIQTEYNFSNREDQQLFVRNHPATDLVFCRQFNKVYNKIGAVNRNRQSYSILNDLDECEKLDQDILTLLEKAVAYQKTKLNNTYLKKRFMDQD